MIRKRSRVQIIILLVIITIFLIALSSLFTSKTTIYIKNNTDKTIENLGFVSIDNREEYKIPSIESYSEISFEYDIGGFNENAVNMRHNFENGIVKSYNLVGYVDRAYRYIHVYINSIDDNDNLIITVEAR